MSAAAIQFRAALRANAVLFNLVGERIIQNGYEDTASFPYVVFSITTTPTYGLDGTNFGDDVVVTCESWDISAIGADAVADAVVAAVTLIPSAAVTARATGYDAATGVDATVLTIDFTPGAGVSAVATQTYADPTYFAADYVA